MSSVGFSCSIETVTIRVLVNFLSSSRSEINSYVYNYRTTYCK